MASFHVSTKPLHAAAEGNLMHHTAPVEAVKITRDASDWTVRLAAGDTRAEAWGAGMGRDR